jgi:multidrug efflux pump subunit AcrB
MEGRDFVGLITQFALKRRVTMFMGLLTVVAIGLIATWRLPLEMNPRG